MRLFDQLAFKAWNKEDWTLFAALHTDDVVAAAAGERTE